MQTTYQKKYLKNRYNVYVKDKECKIEYKEKYHRYWKRMKQQNLQTYTVVEQRKAKKKYVHEQYRTNIQKQFCI